jgi:hypothetical protein
MLGTHKLVLDTFCEVYDLLQPWCDQDFWNFENHDPVPGAIYLIGRLQFRLNVEKIRNLVETNYCYVILSNPAEGSETLKGQCQQLGVADLIKQGRILLIGGGDMDTQWPCLQYDSFLPKVLDYHENVAAAEQAADLYSTADKPYKFLFLNGRQRPNRKYLMESFRLSGLLDQCLWTNLDSRDSASRRIQLWHNGEDLMRTVRPVKYLDPKYELPQYQQHIDRPGADHFVKNQLFDNTWGEIYLKAEPYIDTYFSLVTETVFEYPHSFRTEKIWKPIAMAHPFVVAANYRYYQDLHNLGFQTFDHVIDESFDQIENNQDRIVRIAQVVEDLCKQDLDQFLAACYNVCKYNQQHLAEMRLSVRKQFPDRFAQFIHKHINERP